MKLRRLWIILANGLQLFDYTQKYCRDCGYFLVSKTLPLETIEGYCERCQRKAKAELWSFGSDNLQERLIDTSALFAFLRFFETRFNRKFKYFTFENLLFANFSAEWTYYIYKEQQTSQQAQKVSIRYSILGLAERDLSMPLPNEVTSLLDYCNVINLDFYQDYAEILATLSAIQLEQFAQFREKAENAVVHLDTIAEELQKRLNQMKPTQTA